MYFITALANVKSIDELEDDKDACVSFSSACFGYYENFNVADTEVRNNTCDINETINDYVVIEEIKQGIHPHAEEKQWYKFDYDNYIYQPCDKPESIKMFCNFALG